MADIKTRQSNKGTIRTIDRASAMTSHIKDVHARTKEEMLHSKEQSREQASSQATDQMGQMADAWEEAFSPRRRAYTSASS